MMWCGVVSCKVVRLHARRTRRVVLLRAVVVRCVGNGVLYANGRLGTQKSESGDMEKILKPGQPEGRAVWAPMGPRTGSLSQARLPWTATLLLWPRR